MGITAGLIVALLAEAFVFGAQVLSLQAGFSYASTIDPTNHTDTGLLALLLQLMAGLLFFSLGADRLLVAAVARSFLAIPAGSFHPNTATAGEIIKLLGTALATGFRCAVPMVGVLVLVDLALAPGRAGELSTPTSFDGFPDQDGSLLPGLRSPLWVPSPLFTKGSRGRGGANPAPRRGRAIGSPRGRI